MMVVCRSHGRQVDRPNEILRSEEPRLESGVCEVYLPMAADLWRDDRGQDTLAGVREAFGVVGNGEEAVTSDGRGVSDGGGRKLAGTAWISQRRSSNFRCFPPNRVIPGQSRMFSSARTKLSVIPSSLCKNDTDPSSAASPAAASASTPPAAWPCPQISPQYYLFAQTSTWGCVPDQGQMHQFEIILRCMFVMDSSKSVFQDSTQSPPPSSLRISASKIPFDSHLYAPHSCSSRISSRLPWSWALAAFHSLP